MRLEIALLLGLGSSLALAGCARDNGQADQANAAAAPAPAGSAAPAGEAMPGKLDRSHAGTPAPDLNWQGPQGQPTSMAAFRGRPVLVNLWATWCAPCIVEMPSLDALAVREGDALQVLALSQDMAGREPVTRFFAERNFRALEPHLDQDMAFMTKLDLRTLPTTILYDAQGKEVWRMVGLADWASESAAKLLDEAEAG